MNLKLSLSGIVLAASAAAQTSRVLPDDSLENVWAGNNGTGVGYATQNGISQNLYIAPFSVGSSVQGVGFRRTATTVDFPSFTIDFEISLSSTPADLATLSSTFANNRGSDHTAVLPRQMINIPARAANSAPSSFFTLPTTPWTFAGPNLLIECKSYGTGNVTAWRMDRCFERTTVGEAINWGQSCSTATVASTGGTPAYVGGSTVTLTLAGAAATQPAIALLGFDLNRAFGALPLPYDLGTLGMTGCTLLVDPLAQLATATDGAGAASVALPIPSAGATGLGFGLQWLYADPAASNPLGLVTTTARLVRVGPLICPNRYVWDLSNVNAVTGSLQAGGPVANVITVP